ncbi:MAG: outer membrane lipoprotein-sorting protein [Fidelibacterota bacterium]
MKLKMTQIAMLVLIPMSFSVFAEELTGRDIMLKVDQQRDVRTAINDTKMTLINNRGQTREREVMRYEKSYDGAGGIDKKTLIIFNYPADIRGTGLLLWSYTDPEKDEDRWLYLPALKRIRRIAGESKNDYFMGTDFTYDDMGDRNVDEDTHTLLGEELLNGDECYKIESVAKRADDLYSKKISWVLPEKWVIVKVEFYDKNDALLKELTVSDVRKVDNIWTGHVLFMDNYAKSHQTKIEVRKVEYNGAISDQVFTQTTLQRGRVQ